GRCLAPADQAVPSSGIVLAWPSLCLVSFQGNDQESKLQHSPVRKLLIHSLITEHKDDRSAQSLNPFLSYCRVGKTHFNRRLECPLHILVVLHRKIRTD